MKAREEKPFALSLSKAHQRKPFGLSKASQGLRQRGDSESRRLLHNAAMAGAKTATWRPIYERERAKGLPATAALVALARRLVRVAYSLFKSGQQFDRGRAMA